jgi:signal transduction histidine kinase
MQLRNLPIRKKLQAVILLTSGIVLLLTCLTFIVYETLTFRRFARENLQTLGEVMAQNTAVALAFRSEEDATKVLSTLDVEQDIVRAGLFDETGKLFATYPTNVSMALPTDLLPQGHSFQWLRLQLVYPVEEGDRRFGFLYLESSLRETYQRLFRYGIIALLVMASSFILAYFLSNILQKSISMPIISLAETARTISEKRDFSVRAHKHTNDELGLLTDAFNDMLTEIHDSQGRLSLALEEARKSEQKVRELNLGLERRVTERTEELQDAVAQMETFSYSVSHDLRAPLRALEGYSQALLEDYGGRLDDDATDYLNRIRNSARRMDRLIQDILAYSRVARSELKIEAVNLDDLLRELILQNPAFQEPAAQVVVQAPLIPVLAHEPALAQCISNLLGNAVKFVPPGTHPKVIVSTEALDGNVRVIIHDNGIGIKKDYLDRIFGMFERVHDNKAYEGTGIGLAIVRKAVQRMGGKVGVDSEEGKGSRFWIELPKA